MMSVVQLSWRKFEYGSTSNSIRALSTESLIFFFFEFPLPSPLFFFNFFLFFYFINEWVTIRVRMSDSDRVEA